MGSEHSQLSRPKPSTRSRLARGQTIAFAGTSAAAASSRGSTSGNDSPGASVCSDSEVPYISYTVNRPIGDSPKMSKLRESRRSSSAPQRRHMSLPQKSSKPAHDIVVVKQAASQPNLSTDEHVLRLQEIPTFLPIMRGTLGLTGARDPDVLEGLDYRPWARLACRYQAHVSACTQQVASDQQAITARVKETDAEISRLLAMMVERQRNNARAAERLARVHDVSRQLTRCHSLLNQALEGMETLNNMLPVEERLEPFVWTTG